MCKVSILVPVYNVEKYLRQCMDSLVNQTLKDIEIICIDDGSTDSSPVILDEYAEKDVRVRVIHKSNAGYGHSMNIGLRMARGEFIGIVESDDFADLEMFERLYIIAVEKNVEFVRSNFWIYSEKQMNVFREMMCGCPYDTVLAPYEAPNTLWEDTFLWTSIYRKSFLLDNEIWFNETPGASYQDVGFTLKVLSSAKRAVLIKDAFLHYRIDNANASVTSKEKVNCKRDEIASVWSFLESRPKMREKVCRIIPWTMYCLYKADYRRIAAKYKMQFLGKVFEEFKNLGEKNLLDRRYWEEDSWKEMQEILSDEKTILYDTYKVLQRQRLCMIGFLEEMEKCHKIYIYGAGLIGISVLNVLQKHDLEISGFLVTNMSGNPSWISGLPVNAMGEEAFDKENDAVLVSVMDCNQYEIIALLENAGVKRIIAMNSELREALLS